MWNLSRRRSWGVPFPVFRDKEGALHPDTDSLWEECAKGVAREGTGFWDKMGTPEGFSRESLVADVWFDSGASLYASTGDPKAVADLALEGRDQTRGWFLASLLLNASTSDRAPFARVFSHGFVVDGKGRKLSKSLGNAPSVEEALSFGAEALRLWALSREPTEDLVWSPKALA